MEGKSIILERKSRFDSLPRLELTRGCARGGDKE